MKIKLEKPHIKEVNGILSPMDFDFFHYFAKIGNASNHLPKILFIPEQFQSSLNHLKCSQNK